jgi:glycosyltransferase involved in cell wall biosynthesis
MRVVHIIKAVRIAGAERHVMILLDGLRQRGVDARLVLLVEPAKPMDDYVEQLEERGIPVKRLPIHSHGDFSLYSRLRAMLGPLKLDIAHTHLIHADLYGIPTARTLGVPLVITTRHNDDVFRRRQPMRVMNRTLWQMADAGIAISNAVARFSIEVEGAPPEKMHTIYYGLEYKPREVDRQAARLALRRELGLPGEALLIGTVSRLIAQKGLTYGLQAFARVCGSFPDAHLVIVGEGPLLSELRTEARRMGIAERIHFLGWRQDVPQVMAALDIFLMPSLWEGFGLVLLEAMAQAVPVVGSAVSAIPEVVVHGETGLLVPARNVDMLADALGQLMSDNALRHYMGMMGEDRLETQFSARRMSGETLALYGSLLASKRKGQQV